MPENDEPVLKDGPEVQTLFPDVDNSDKTPDPEPDPNTSKIEALEKEIADGKERDSRNQEIINNMSQQPAPVATVQTTETAPEEVPDPITDPDGYRNHLKAEIKGEVKQEIGQMRSETAKKEIYNEIWTDFAKQNKDLAENHIGLVKYQATELLREIAGRGVDPQQYLITNKGVFMDDVANRTNSMISKIKGDNVDTGRTGGVLSNSPRTATPKTPSDNEPKVTSFVEELQKEQMKTGFF